MKIAGHGMLERGQGRRERDAPLRSHRLRESIQHPGRIGIACADTVDDAVERQRVALDDAAAIDQEAAELVVPGAVDDAVGPGQPVQARALG